jgi:protein-tyrosine phosphatase
MTILFVCSGNTCRSPLAVAAWSRLAGTDAGIIDGANVVSAGAFASEGAPASRHAVAVALDWGYDLSAHRARQLRDEEVKRADLICTMTQSQADVLRDRYPGDAAKIRVLGSGVVAVAKCRKPKITPSAGTCRRRLKLGG